MSLLVNLDSGITKMINKIIFCFFISICYLSATEDRKWLIDEKKLIPKEECFRYRDKLQFKFPGEVSIDFDSVHDNLKNFETQCSDSYYKKIDNACFRLGTDDKNNNKNKNLAVFSVSILLQNNDQVRSAVFQENKLFISGEKQPFIINNNVKGNNKQVIDFVEVDNKIVKVFSLENSIPNHYQNPNKIRGYQDYSKDRKKYLNEDLYIGFGIRDRYYPGFFGNQTHLPPSYIPIAFTINNALNAGNFSDQFYNKGCDSGWCGSLVDSEQSLRIYFQENCEGILDKLKELSKPNLQEKVLGIVLHIHSHMDVCGLCNATLVQMMNMCNNHTYEHRSLLFEKFYNAFDNTLSKDFRFRITITSKEPYIKLVKNGLSRRNWCGGKLNLNSLDGQVDFIKDDYIIHKTY